MGLFAELFPMSPITLLGKVKTKKEEIAISQQSQPNVPFQNLKKVTGGSNVTYTEGTKDYSTSYYYPTNTGSGEIVIQTKKEQSSSPDISQASERGLGSLGAVASGENASASSKEGSTSILTYALIGAGVLAGIYIIKKV